MKILKSKFLRSLLYCWAFISSLMLVSVSLHAEESANKDEDINIIKLLQIKGDLTQGSAIIGKLPSTGQLWLNDQPVTTTPQGDFFIGFGRDAELTQKLTYKLKNAEKKEGTLLLTQREYHVQKVNGVPQKTVNPDPESLARIREENVLVDKARGIVTDLEYFLDRFKAPMDAPISGVYGSQRVYNGEPKRPHFGVDYAGPIGAPVYAPASGKVSLTHNDMFYSGGTLIIDHGYGVSSSFLHLSEILVKEGQDVKQGDLIAKVGKGGRATGPHLDWRMNWYDVRIDPLKVLKIYQ